MNKKMHQPGDVNLLIDWCSFTVTRFDLLGLESNEQYILDRVLGKFMLRGLTYERRQGRYGWNVCYTSQGITVAIGGRDDVWVEMSGTGCRAWESLNPKWTWEQYFQLLDFTYPSLHYSRLDVACDTFGLLDSRKLVKWTMAHKYISRWRSPECRVGDNVRICYYGSPSSDFLCRIYDKTLERFVKGSGDEEVPPDWVRIEFQLRNKAISSFFSAWSKTGDLSLAFFGLLRNQLVFTQGVPDRDNRNQGRAIIAPWWSRLLGNAGRIKMAYSGGMEYNLQSLRKFVVIQAGSSVRTYVELFGEQELLKVVQQRPLNDRQRALLEEAQHVELPDEGVS